MQAVCCCCFYEVSLHSVRWCLSWWQTAECLHQASDANQFFLQATNAFRVDSPSVRGECHGHGLRPACTGWMYALGFWFDFDVPHACVCTTRTKLWVWCIAVCCNHPRRGLKYTIHDDNVHNMRHQPPISGYITSMYDACSFWLLGFMRTADIDLSSCILL